MSISFLLALESNHPIARYGMMMKAARQYGSAAPPTSDLNFLKDEVMPWYDIRRKVIANRPLIRQQAFGEALDPHLLERLGRYEVHLDRKVERTLSTLLRLQEIWHGRPNEPC